MTIFNKSITLEKFIKNLELEGRVPVDDLSAINSSGIPAELAVIIRKHNILFGETMTTIRVGTHPHHDTPRESKPLTVHSKTVNHGFLYGYICTANELAKIDSSGRVIKTALNPHDLENNKSIQLKLTLREILRSISLDNEQERDMEIVKVIPEISMLVLKYKDGKGPVDFDGEFYINLNDENREIVPHNYIMGDPNIPIDISLENKIKRTSLLSSNEEQKNIWHLLKDFWDANNQENCLNMAIPINYRSNQNIDTQIQPLNVLAYDDKPITGDWDIDSESVPIGLPEYAYVPIDTMNDDNATDQQTILLWKAKRLFEYFKLQILNETKKKNKTKKLSTITDSLLGKLIVDDKDLQFENIYFAESLAKYTGIITPFEFLQNTTRNYFYRSMVDSSIACIPLQHGPETHSPFKADPSISPNSDGPRMHVYKNYIFYTENEIQRVKLCLVKGFLEKNYPGIPPWPAFSMEKWHPVIKKQIKLKQKISQQTIEAYNLYKLLDKLEKNKNIGNKDILKIHIQIEKYKEAMLANKSATYSGLPYELQVKYDFIRKKSPQNNRYRTFSLFPRRSTVQQIGTEINVTSENTPITFSRSLALHHEQITETRGNSSISPAIVETKKEKTNVAETPIPEVLSDKPILPKSILRRGTLVMDDTIVPVRKDSNVVDNFGMYNPLVPGHQSFRRSSKDTLPEKKVKGKKE